MQIVEEIEVKHGFGKGKDESDDLSHQTYAEKMVLSDDFMEALKGLKVAHREGDKMVGGFIMLTNVDVLPFRDDGKEIGMNGICHKLNQVFAAGHMPFFATSHASENAEKRFTVKSRGKNIGESYTAVKADYVKVYRISNEWNIDNYAVYGSANLKKTAYHQPTIGMKLRTEKVIGQKNIAF